MKPIKIDDKWEYYKIENEEHENLLKKERKKSYYGRLGKYLLFSKSKKELLEFTRNMVISLKTSHFKISIESSDNGDFSFVSEIYHYYHCPLMSKEIMNNLKENIIYRGFKQEWKSKAKVYSKQYLKSKNNG